MKVNKSDAIALLKGLGFQKAVEWENEKIAVRLGQVPESVQPEEVPKEHVKFYEELGQANGEIELIDDVKKEPAKKEEEEPKARKSSVDRAVDKAARTKEKEEEKMKKTKGKGAKAKGKEKPAKAKKAAVKEDAYGAKEGSIRAAVNAKFPKDWTSLEEIATAADVKPRQARIRLRRAVKGKILEVRRRVEYRLLPKK